MFIISLLYIGSNPAVGSSSTKILGSPTIAIAKDNFLFPSKDRWFTILYISKFNPH